MGLVGREGVKGGFDWHYGLVNFPVTWLVQTQCVTAEVQSGHFLLPVHEETASLSGPDSENPQLLNRTRSFNIVVVVIFTVFNKKKAAWCPEKKLDCTVKQARPEILSQLLTHCVTFSYICYISKHKVFNHKMQIASILEAGNNWETNHRKQMMI